MTHFRALFLSSMTQICNEAELSSQSGTQQLQHQQQSAVVRIRQIDSNSQLRRYYICQRSNRPIHQQTDGHLAIQYPHRLAAGVQSLTHKLTKFVVISYSFVTSVGPSVVWVQIVFCNGKLTSSIRETPLVVTMLSVCTIH